MNDPDQNEEPDVNLSYEERQFIAYRLRNQRRLLIGIATVAAAGLLYFLNTLGMIPKFSFDPAPKPIPIDETPPPDFTPAPFLTADDKNLQTLRNEIVRQAALQRDSYDSSTDKAALTAIEFLTARTLDERLAWVRQPERVAPMMREYYAKGDDRHPEFKQLLGRASLTVAGREVITISFSSQNNSALAIALLRDGDDQRFLVDWESFVSYSDIPTEVFIEKKPTTPTTFRVYANIGDYYNFQFSDQSKYQCISLENRDGDLLFYGYVTRDQAWLDTIFPSRAPSQAPRALTLKISFPADPPADNIVLIDEFVTAWWFAP